MLDAVLKKAGITEPGFTHKTVKWAITFTSQGSYTGVVPLSEGKGREYPCCPNLSQPELVGGDDARSHFLTESLSTIALYWKDELEQKDQEKSCAKHKYFCRLLKDASQVMPCLSIAGKILTDENIIVDIHTDLKHQKAKPTDAATFIIDGVNPLEQDDWHDWWREFRESIKKPKDTFLKMRCIATGKLIEPVLTHPVKIKGLTGVGGLGTGDVLVGFDKQAFQSYGLEQAANAAMSEETATAYAETLNQLIKDKGIKLGSTLSTYWFLEAVPVEDDPFPWLIEPPVQTQVSAELKARDLLKAIHEGKRPDLSNNRYMALILSGAVGRVMVREIIAGSFENLVSNIDRWFSHLSIVNREGNGLASQPKFFSVVNAIEFLSKDGKILRNIDDVPPPLIHELWRSAVTGSHIPSSAMSRTLMRIRSDIVSDMPPLETRFSIIKSYLLRKGDKDMQPYLNPDHPHPAYHCGRLLAVFARLQRTALGDVGAGVVQRYYTAASQTPGLILGRLTANAKNHLAKLEGGLAYWFEDLIADVMSCIKDTVPRTLTLEEQSLFALGYYQQLASLNAGKGGKKKDTENNNLNNEEENK
ncbi:MAG: type I-C CRISPR-associated protein Cas8c/Csd1 [Nitrospiraceae bacterium]|nr:MAG: type I-C CRISPR-associated protein Cas8c/Csd1 [Nitrospiraceae bacterium]